MAEEKTSINPKHTMGILRRYLHVIALLQNNKDPKDWNSNSLADLLSEEIINGELLSDKVIRGDIEKYIEGDLGLSVEKTRGARRMGLSGDINKDTMMTLLMTYSNFVITDSSKESALLALYSEKKDICLWILARIHFSIIKRNKIIFDYTSNNNNRSTVTVHPYHIIHRENNIYLVGKRDSDSTTGQYYLSRIENLKILEATFEETIPTIEELYSHSLGAFIWDELVHMTIRYKAECAKRMMTEFSSLEPTVKDLGKWHEMTFYVKNYEAVCRQLFFYGDQVVIISPDEVKNWMVDTLKQSLSMYNK